MIYSPVPSNNSSTLVRCTNCTALVSLTDRDSHDAFHANYIPKEQVQQMSSAAWCDPGNHAYKAGEPGSQTFSGTQVDENGNTVRMELNACKDHSFSPMAGQNTPKEIQ